MNLATICVGLVLLAVNLSISIYQRDAVGALLWAVTALLCVWDVVTLWFLR